MLGKYKSNDMIRKYTVVIGSLFDDIYVERDKADGSRDQLMKVPLRYGPKDKNLIRKDREDSDSLEQKYAIQYPAMSYEFIDMRYDANRALNKMQKIKCGDKFVYNPSPWSIYYNLYIGVNKETDGLRIIEQILPFFRPSFRVPVKVLTELGITNDVPISLESIQKQDPWDGMFTDRRDIVWTLSFKVDGYIYGEVEEGKLIKKVEIDIFNNLELMERIEVTGGQTANGQAVESRPPSVDWNLVDPDLPHSFIVDIT